MRRQGHKPYTKTFRVKSQAEAWARQIEADIDANRTPTADKVLGRSVTVGDLIAEYRKLRDDSRPIADTSNERYMLNKLEIYLGDKDAMRLEPADLVQYAKIRAKEGAGPYTINMDISKLGTVSRLVSASLRMKIPDVVGEARPLLLNLKLIGGGGKRDRRPTDDELERVLSCLEVRRGKVYADAVKFAVLACLRRGEITRVLWSGLDKGKKLLLIKDRKDPRQKEGNDQWIPLLNGAWELVNAQPKIDDRIFPIHPQTLSKYFTEACRELSIPDLHLHDMRHEGTSRLFEQGYSIEQVALVTGHSSWVHLKRYTNLRPEDLHAAPPRA